MLEELQKFNKLGTKEELLFILFKVLSINEYKVIEDVKILCIHHSYTFGSSFYGDIRILELLKLVKIESDKIKVDESISLYKSDNFFENQFIYERLFQLLGEENKLDLLFNQKNTKQNSSTQQYYIKGNQIPFSLNYIKKFLINIEFLELVEDTHNSYFVKNIFTDFFTNSIVKGLKKNSIKRKISLANLKKIQEIQNKHGVEAEEYVLNFEIKRLSRNSLRKNIQIISEKFSNAGYDIESFDTEDSIVYDRFIEVKSYHEKLSFFWTKNEIEVAKELGDMYFLYLVDRRYTQEINYKPFIIQNPIANILENDNWKKEADSFKISANFNL